MSEMPPPIRISFETNVLELPIERILPLRPMTERITGSRRYGRIVSSIKEVGVIEPLVVTAGDANDRHMLLDGHLRLQALRDQGATTAPCIISDDDEAFSPTTSASIALRRCRSIT
jgi:ParB-like chromosome segregation protein Spo0J